MPRRLLAILLILSLSYQCFVKLGIVIWYEYNKDYVAKNLCENRARPEKKCCGKCYLRKQLKKADEGNTKGNTLPEKWNLGEVMVFIVPSATLHIPFVPNAIKASIPLVNERYLTYDPLNSVFHPPLAAC